MTGAPSSPNRACTSGTRFHWAVLGLFALLTLGLTWPVIADLSGRVPGTSTWAFDESTFAWNLWYLRHALLDLHANPLHTELIWYPLGIDLILYTYNLFNALIALPLQIAFNLPLASNLTLFIATILSGFGGYLLTLDVLGTRSTEARLPGAASRDQTHLRLASLLAGMIYAFASNRAVYAALGHYDMVTTLWLPFFALYLLRTLRQPTTANALMTGLFFALAALAEMIFAAFLGLFSLVVVLVAWSKLARRRTVLSRLGLAALFAMLIWSPVLVPIVREFATGDYALSRWGESVKLSGDVVGLVTPTDLNPLFGPGGAGGQSWAASLRQVEEGKGRFGDINTVFLGYLTLGLALVGVWRGRHELKAWVCAALVFGLLVLGPLLQINGRYRFSLDGLLPDGVTFPLPFALLHDIPVVNANRAPNRNSVILMLALAVLAGYGAAWLLGSLNARLERRGAARGALRQERMPRVFAVFGITALIGLAIAAEHLAVPLPTTDARVPEVYRRIAQEPGDFAIMQLPLGWRNSFGTLGSELTLLQYYQTAHGKPMLGGNISRAPAYKMAYFSRIPLFQALTDLEMYRDVPPDVDAAARAQAGALMALYDVRYFITNPPIAGRFPYQDTSARTEAYALEVLPLEKPPIWEADGIKAYRVIQPPVSFPFRLDLGTAGTEPYLGQGWDMEVNEKPYDATATWATGKTADLYLPMGQAMTTTLRLNLAPLAYAGAPPQTLSMSFNGVPILRNHRLATGWQLVEAPVPATATRRGPNRVRLDFGWAASPREVLPDPASRAVIGGTGVVSPVNIEAHAFDEAYITLYGADGTSANASAGRRGYNVAVVDPRSGKLLDMQGFDTAANGYEADALATYLNGIAPGRIVVMASKGDAAMYINQAAVAAMQRLGSRVTAPEDVSGQAHALVGVQGARPGTAAEVIAPEDAYLSVSGDFRHLAAAVDWVELAP